MLPGPRHARFCTFCCLMSAHPAVYGETAHQHYGNTGSCNVQEDQIKEVVNRFQSFHKKFMDQYR